MANQYGVKVQPLDLSDQYAPNTKTYHGIQILFNGRVVGRITNWDVTPYTRDATLIYELDRDTAGMPVDIVPGKTTGRTITATRVELWKKEVETVIVPGQHWADLSQQIRAFWILENMYAGSDLYQTYVYVGCWFTDRKEDPWAADGDFVVRAQLAITFVNRIAVFHQ